ncbi:MAG: aminotransferase class I/II-fold pyridoxal phosphate-dependent enzyme, partial [Syntrophaceae bacterium]|nr:aminotransferase class I/II-fold pyridoxal phosphate-dependent enzyme [Syntrophaceae bacterium]
MDPHGGNTKSLAAAAGIPEGELLDFSANINPLGPPEWFRPLISSQVERLAHYPDPGCTALVEGFAERYGVPADEILIGNGETELLYLLPLVLGKPRALIPSPAYADYGRAAAQAGLAVETLPLTESRGFALDLEAVAAALKGDEVLFLGQPNNPTGGLVAAGALRELARRYPATSIVVDEAFLEFTEAESLLAPERPPNIAVLRSLTKFYAIPGLRLGAVIADRRLTERLRSLIPPWSV